jgi:hypothetical protein
MNTEGLISTGKVVGIYISSTAGGAMRPLSEADAIAGAGIAGDRYCVGIGSFNDVSKGRGGIGSRQVSLINARFFSGTPFDFGDSRRNIVTMGVELLWLLKGRKEFRIGEAVFRAINPLDPCGRPSNLSGKPGFKEAFFDCGAIIAEVVQSGNFRINDPVFHVSKGYK